MFSFVFVYFVFVVLYFIRLSSGVLSCTYDFIEFLFSFAYQLLLFKSACMSIWPAVRCCEGGCNCFTVHLLHLCTVYYFLSFLVLRLAQSIKKLVFHEYIRQCLLLHQSVVLCTCFLPARDRQHVAPSSLYHLCNKWLLLAHKVYGRFVVFVSTCSRCFLKWNSFWEWVKLNYRSVVTKTSN